VKINLTKAVGRLEPLLDLAVTNLSASNNLVVPQK
jgi:hypothetical protein